MMWSCILLLIRSWNEKRERKRNDYSKSYLLFTQKIIPGEREQKSDSLIMFKADK